MPRFTSKVARPSGPVTFNVNLNIMVVGSKALGQDEKEALEMPEGVRVIVLDAKGDQTQVAGSVLVDVVVPAKVFTPDKDGRQSCGYGVQERGLTFG